jgi:hypothetical protein
MSRFLLLGDILSLSEAKGTKNAFPGKARVAAFADVIHARIKSESEYKWKKISRFQNRNSFSLSLSPKRKRNAETLSLFTFAFSLFRPKKVRFERTNRERERGYDLLKAFRLSLQKVCLSRRGRCWIFEKVTNFSFEQSVVG